MKLLGMGTQLLHAIFGRAQVRPHVLPRATGLFAPAAPGPWKLDNLSTQNAKGRGVSSSKHKGVVRALCCLCSMFPFKGLAH